MADKSKRFAAFFAAIFFLVASLATSVGVIWVLVTQKNNKPATPDQNQQSSQTSTQNGKKLEGFTPVAKVDQLKVTDTKVGDGAEAKADSKITVAYTGALANNGTIFDASPDGQPVQLTLSQVIPGWQQGIPGMKVGGTRQLLIPAALAYGAQSPDPSIPANSDLVFNVTLVKVE